MRKKKSEGGRGRSRAKAAAHNFNEYLRCIPKAARTPLKKMRAAIRSVLPAEATETISYGIPAFSTTKIVVWIAGFAHHCSLFPTAAVVAQFKDELKPYSTSKGTIHFPVGKPLPSRLVKRIVRARLAQM